ncbi:riboflavin biosynthesis protein RibF [Limosilactobacillus caecicola]|uniref:riboflavin biosynthesis protein RibF n=1 Tax=Limosilactobacillus caecicola TaxID=2941332 RepID=UPI00203A4714|nr:riboflavin biosynthesis protein RibF [Limosilactobacillus caecicola]
MKTIQLSYPIDPAKVAKGPVVLAMGFFDGVHRGHQQVIGQAREIAAARQQPLAVLTYDKLPAIVFRQLPQPVRYLTPLPLKLQLFAKLGVDVTYVMDFTSTVGHLSPQNFVDEVLMQLQVSAVVAGYDHTYGPREIANMQRLPDYVRDRFTIRTVGKLAANDGDMKVSSTAIRQLIDEGQVGAANEQLGYEYLTTGIVVHGFARGRTIGFPTANVQWTENERIPAIGVYVVQLKVQGHWYDGMASVGYNVTFGEQKNKTIEVNLFNFAREIYGEHVVVRWVQRLRGEVKFASATELVNQLKKDRQLSKEILGQHA